MFYDILPTFVSFWHYTQFHSSYIYLVTDNLKALETGNFLNTLPAERSVGIKAEDQRDGAVKANEAKTPRKWPY